MSGHKENDPRIEQAGASDESIQRVHSVLLREKAEPSEGFAPMPLALLGFVSAMIFIVSIYFIHNRGGLTKGFDTAAMIYDERYDPDKYGSDKGAAKEVDPMVAGKRYFNQVCATCHQASGLGVPGAFPPLVGSEWVTGSDERLIHILLNGLQGPVEVEGQTYNGVMPAFGASGTYNWKDDRIAHVLTYIRAEWGNNAAAITPERVAEIRAADTHKGAWSAEDLLQLP